MQGSQACRLPDVYVPSEDRPPASMPHGRGTGVQQQVYTIGE